MAVFSRACEYGIHAVLFLAAEKGTGRVTIGSLAERYGMSFHYLTTICRELTVGGVLRSYKGPNGGVALARPATEISLLDVVKAFNGGGIFNGGAILDRCVLGLESCSPELPCPVHSQWATIGGVMNRMLSGTTFQELADELNSGEGTLKRILLGSARRPKC